MKIIEQILSAMVQLALLIVRHGIELLVHLAYAIGRLIGEKMSNRTWTKSKSRSRKRRRR